MESGTGDQDQEQEEQCLAVALFHVHGIEVYALMDSGHSELLVSSICKKTCSQAPESNKVVTVANGNRLDMVGKVLDVPVLFEQLEAKFYFLSPNVPFDLVIGLSSLRQLGGVLDFKSGEVFPD